MSSKSVLHSSDAIILKGYKFIYFNKTIIPLGLVGYDMIIANSALPALLALTISYPTIASGITVKYQIMSLNQGQVAIITPKRKENA